jgi:hypothetical protein
MLLAFVFLAVLGFTSSYNPLVCVECTQSQNNICFDLANEALYNPENWDVGLGEQWCNYIRTRLECLKSIFCEFAGDFDIARNIKQLEGVIDYYEKWGICNNTVPSSLGECHLAMIREGCCNETILHVRSKFSMSCLETVRLVLCIYERQVTCEHEIIPNPNFYVNVMLLQAGNCCYRPLSNALMVAGDEWRAEHPDGYCVCDGSNYQLVTLE